MIFHHSGGSGGLPVDAVRFFSFLPGDKRIADYFFDRW
jgi:hypothetical protein